MGFGKILGSAYRMLVGAAEKGMELADKSMAEKERYIKSAESSGRITSQQAEAAMQKLHSGMSSGSGPSQSGLRRTDEELSKDKTGIDKKPEDFSYEKNVLLSDARLEAPSEPGVYVLRLHGKVMKCGRASYSGGVRWRFAQYYNLNYDNKAREGELWSINKENRDDVVVSWQCCPPSQCHELEYKLFKKYGKGAWADRAPASCSTNNWKLLI